MPGHQGYRPSAQKRTEKNPPVSTRVAPHLIDQIESAAHSLNVPRHYILKAALRLGVPLAIGELTAQSQTQAKE